MAVWEVDSDLLWLGGVLGVEVLRSDFFAVVEDGRSHCRRSMWS